MLAASTLSNGGKQELMHYVHYISSCSPPLDGVDTSDMIDTGREEEFIWLPFKNKLANKKAAGMVRTCTVLKDMQDPNKRFSPSCFVWALCAQICSAFF